MKKLLLAVVISLAFFLGYGVVGKAWPGVPDRAEWRGYFTNVRDTTGTFVLPNVYGGFAYPSYINTADEFIGFIEGKLGGNAQERTGAAFLIQTMIGLARDRPPTAAQIADWESRVRAADAAGLVNWRTRYTYSINSYYQGPRGGGAPNDDAFFTEADTADAMVFRNTSGAVVYAIKWLCSNPVGNVAPLSAGLNYNISGRTVVSSNPTPKPGESVGFSHYVRNDGPTSTGGTHVWWIAIDPAAGITGGAADSGTYLAGQEKNVYNETAVVPAGTPAGTKICRLVGWDPVNSSGARDGRGVPACATVRYDYALSPIVSVTINGGATPGNTAEEGDQITFTYIVNNGGTTQSLPTACTASGRTYPGYQASPGGLTPIPLPIVCTTFPYNSSTTVKTETITATGNTTVCRSLTVNPRDQNLPPTPVTSAITCAYVANKPYVKAFGGDVAAGAGLTNASGACTNNTNATIIGWNKRNDGANPWAGAGTQYAALALNVVRDFGTTQQSGGAAAPSGLAFANNGITVANQNAGTYSKPLGALGCIPDYYASKPTSATSVTSPINPNSLTTGAWTATGTTTINAASLGAGKRLVIFVDGDAYINGPITYNGAWGKSDVPLFELVVRGNIYISKNVPQLDGVYIAQQRTDGSRGYVYTCATSAAAIPLDGNLFGDCNSRLTVNGPVVANRIYLLRTAGTLRQSTVAEGRTTSNAGEIFNYNPVNWIAQPTGLVKATPDEYDSITSLPPVL